MRRCVTVAGALALLAHAPIGCIQVTRTPSHPTTFEGIEAMCRQVAEDYRERGRAYARCMRDHGYPNQGPDDY